MLDVNATAPTLKGMGETKVVSSVSGGTMGREVLLPPFGTVDLSSVWQSMGVSPANILSFSGVWSAEPQPSTLTNWRT
jgi:hypothetical protein